MTTSSFSFCLRLVLAMAGAGMFAACDPGVVYNQIVQNDSSHDIWVYTYGLATDPDQPAPVLDSALIPAGVTSSIYEYSHMGTVGLFTACRSFAYDSLSRQTSEAWYDNVTDADAEQNVRKTYTTTYDEAGRVASAGDGVNDLQYTYSIFGLLSSITQDLDDSCCRSVLCEHSD